MHSKFSLENLVSTYCNSQIAMRGRIQSFDESSFDMAMLRRRRRLQQNRMLSMHIAVPRRDRRFFKGANILYENGGFLSEKSFHQNHEARLVEKYQAKKELDMFVLSNFHLNLIKNRRRKQGHDNKRSLLNQTQEHCGCEMLHKEKSSVQHRGAKYLILANVLRIKKNQLLLNSQKNDFIAIVNERASGRISKIRLVHVTGIFKWNKVRAFVDYLENFSIDKQSMCTNIKQTVYEINQAQAMYF
jgi:hypothetical protein